jgi:hypothetical protein
MGSAKSSEYVPAQYDASECTPENAQVQAEAAPSNIIDIELDRFTFREAVPARAFRQAGDSRFDGKVFIAIAPV